MRRLVLRRALCRTPEAEMRRDLFVADGCVRSTAAAGDAAAELELDDLLLLPAFVNAYDVLDTATLPILGRPPYASVYDRVRDSAAALAGLGPALSVPLADRLFLGGMRNLFAGVGSVLHHNPDHRSLGRPDFPVRVQRRYAFAHSPGLVPRLRRTYRTSDRRVPWIVRAGEGSDPALRREVDQLLSANVLRHNTVVAHGTAFEAEEAARLAAAEACLVWCPESDLRLYGRTPSLSALRASGLRVGLGSDGAPCGARDLLSTLALAARESRAPAADLLELATRASAAVARLPLGGFEDGAPADFVGTRSLERLLAGERGAVSLLIVRGRPVYGEPQLVAAAEAGSVRITVDGALRAIASEPGRRFVSLLRKLPRRAEWLAGLAL